MRKVLEFKNLVMEGIQQRKELNQTVVKKYALEMADGAKFPVPVVFVDKAGKQYLADGYHRVAAMVYRQLTSGNFEIKEGTREDAILYNLSANVKHGLSMSTAEKQQAVWAILNNPAFTKMSDREIGKTCGVDHKTVGKYRKLKQEGKTPFDPKPKKEAGEKTGDDPKKVNEELTKKVEKLEKEKTELTEKVKKMEANAIDVRKILKLVDPEQFKEALKNHPELLAQLEQVKQILTA